VFYLLYRTAGTVTGIIVGVIALCIVVGVIVYCYCMRKKKRKAAGGTVISQNHPTGTLTGRYKSDVTQLSSSLVGIYQITALKITGLIRKKLYLVIFKQIDNIYLLFNGFPSMLLFLIDFRT